MASVSRPSKLGNTIDQNRNFGSIFIYLFCVFHTTSPLFLWYGTLPCRPIKTPTREVAKHQLLC